MDLLRATIYRDASNKHDPHQEYVVRVEQLLGPGVNGHRRGQKPSKSTPATDADRPDIRTTTWTVQRRYNDFRNLHLSLQNTISGFDLEFPGKKMTGNLGQYKNVEALIH